MAKNLRDFLNEAEADVQVPNDDQKERLINFIVQNFYKFINNPNIKDDRSLLLLVAALATISAADEDSPTALQGARRLAQAAMARSGKVKKEPV